MTDIYLGPTAYEAAYSRIRGIDRQIRELRQQREYAVRRHIKYYGSTILESERIATDTEVFQTKLLPES